MRYNTLGIHVTNTCNMECAHCITDSSPSVRGDLTWDEIEAAVRSSAPYIDGVCVTGGEPWLRRETALATIRLTRELNLVPSMISNGFWARNTDDETDRVFSELSEAGLDKLAVSYDGFHNAHERLVSIATLSRLLACGSATGIRLQVQYCGRGDDEAYREVEELTARHRVPLIASGVLPFGRGRQLAVLRHPRIENVPGDACGVVVRPVLTPERDLYTCCGPARGAAPESPLRLPINNEAAHTGDALRRAASSPLLNLLHTQGPRAAYERLSPSTQARVAGRLLDESFCSLCRAITDDPAAVTELEALLEDDRFFLLAASGYMQVNAKRREMM
ncbi:hypothetical protein GCM10027294_12200 [Marinactinospora endophytica]